MTPKKNQYIKIRVSLEDKALIEKKAMKAESTVSDFLRKLCLDYRVRQNSKQKNLLRDIARISSNLNQIARYVNTFKNDVNKLKLIFYLSRISEEVKGLKDDSKIL